MARCPNCKEPVSQFAAGGAVCGADLEAARRAKAGKRQLALPRVPALPQDVVVLFVLSLLTLCAPLFGVLITAFVIRRENALDQAALRRAIWVVVAVGLALLIAPETRYGGALTFLYD